MPSLIITGHPCIGKTTFAQILASRAQQLHHQNNNNKTNTNNKAIENVIIINEENTCHNYTKNECYESSKSEKKVRSLLKTEFDRHVSTSSSTSTSKTLVILDSTNYIKGYRYELYCISKAAKQRHGIIWILLNDDNNNNDDNETTTKCSSLAKEWNKKRALTNPKESYIQNDEEDNDDDVMTNLIQRYEPPDQRNRWDRPLYRVNIASTLHNNNHQQHDEDNNNNDDESVLLVVEKAAKDALKKSVYNMHSLDQAIATQSQYSPLPNNNDNNDNNESEEEKKKKKKKKKKVMGSTFKRATTTTTTTSDNAHHAPPIKTKTEDDKTKTEEEDEEKHHHQQQESKIIHETKTMSSNKKPKKKKTLEDIADEILQSFLFDIEPLKEGLSTASPITTSANLLHEVDSIVSRVCTALLSKRQQNQNNDDIISSQNIIINYTDIFPSSSNNTNTEQYIIQHWKEFMSCSMKLQIHRQSYLQWIAVHPPSNNDDEDWNIVLSFLMYLEAQP